MQVSAYVDGELPENEAELLLRRMSQDPKLRQEVAEYLALGRLMRQAPGLAGADRLHSRVVAEIDHGPADEENIDDVRTPSRAVRPLAGIAIAAAVALVALFSLQQNTAVDELPQMGDEPVVDMGVSGDITQQERQRQYFLNHAETSSQMGANGMNSRVVTGRFSEEITDEELIDELSEQVEDEEAPEQP